MESGTVTVPPAVADTGAIDMEMFWPLHLLAVESPQTRTQNAVNRDLTIAPWLLSSDMAAHTSTTGYFESYFPG